jgi:hypothetical protein
MVSERQPDPACHFFMRKATFNKRSRMTENFPRTCEVNPT